MDIATIPAYAMALGASQVPGARYAVYFAPQPDSAWWHFGSNWLGRDAVTNLPVAHPAIAPYDAATLARITATPIRLSRHAQGAVSAGARIHRA